MLFLNIRLLTLSTAPTPKRRVLPAAPGSAARTPSLTVRSDSEPTTTPTRLLPDPGRHHTAVFADDNGRDSKEADTDPQNVIVAVRVRPLNER